MCAGRYAEDPHAEWALEGWGDDAFDYEPEPIAHYCNEHCPEFQCEMVNGQEKTFCSMFKCDVEWVEDGNGDPCVW